VKLNNFNDDVLLQLEGLKKEKRDLEDTIANKRLSFRNDDTAMKMKDLDQHQGTQRNQDKRQHTPNHKPKY
jgi:hypothetical protein